MAVANGDGESVGGIVRCGDFGQPQEKAHHSLDLVFFCPSISDDGAFYLERRVFKNGNSVLSGSQEGYTPGMAQFQRRLNVGGVKNPLDGQGINRLVRENLRKIHVYLQQPFVEGTARPGLNRSIDHGLMP